MSQKAARDETDGKTPRQAEPALRLPPLWRNSDYVGWWVGNTVSALGTSVSTIAYTLLVLSLTGSVAQAGLVGSVNLIGILVTTLWGGVLADRTSRRVILVLVPLIQGVILGGVAVLTAAHEAHVPLLLVASLLSGLSSGVVLGSSTPALRRIVPREQLPTANGQAMGRDMAAQLLGSPLGGLLFAVARWIPFGADALSFVFAALGALHIRRPLGPDRGEQRKAPLLHDAMAGLSFVRSQPFLRFVVVLASLLNMIGQAFLLLLIALARHRGADPTTIGLVISMTAAGGLVGSFLAPAVVKHVAARTVLYLAIWPYTAAVAVVAVVPRPWEIMVVVFLTQVAAVPVNVVVQSYVVRVVPDSLLGRVAAVNRFGAYGIEWFGPLLAGLFVGLFGPSGGMLALLIILLPLAVSLHFSRGLNILETPLDQVEELAAR